MAVFHKFDVFAEQVARGAHELVGSVHVLKCYLTNTVPDVTHRSKTALPEITAGNGYPAGGVTTMNVGTAVGGAVTVVATDQAITASGVIGPFRWVVLYNASLPMDELIGWWDYAIPVTLGAQETFTIDFGAELLTVV